MKSFSEIDNGGTEEDIEVVRTASRGVSSMKDQFERQRALKEKERAIREEMRQRMHQERMLMDEKRMTDVRSRANQVKINIAAGTTGRRAAEQQLDKPEETILNEVDGSVSDNEPKAATISVDQEPAVESGVFSMLSGLMRTQRNDDTVQKGIQSSDDLSYTGESVVVVGDSVVDDVNIIEGNRAGPVDASDGIEEEKVNRVEIKDEQKKWLEEAAQLATERRHHKEEKDKKMYTETAERLKADRDFAASLGSTDPLLLIDITCWVDKTSPSCSDTLRNHIANQLNYAFSNSGFALIKGHGIESESIDLLGTSIGIYTMP